jgi:hypothetical protein
VTVQKNFCTYLVCAIYQLPKPVYNSNEFVACLQGYFDDILFAIPGSKLCIVGDFNQLRLTDFLSDTGLPQLVNKPARGCLMIDLFLTNIGLISFVALKNLL